MEGGDFGTDLSDPDEGTRTSPERGLPPPGFAVPARALRPYHSELLVTSTTRQPGECGAVTTFGSSVSSLLKWAGADSASVAGML